MKTYEINVQEPYFSFIKNEIKTIEGRLNKGKFLEMKTGDQLLLNQEVHLEVINKRMYASFKEMILTEGMSMVVPDAKNIEEAETAYYKFYTKEDEKQFGVVAIEVKVITNESTKI